MPRYMIIDTETNGLPDFKLPADDPKQPLLASLCMIKTDQDCEPITINTMLVRPDGWEISPEITAINGLTTERCAAEGVPIRDVLAAYSAAILEGYVVVAFNAQFDCKVVRGELRRLEMPDLFEQTPNICAMRSSMKLGAKKASGKGGFPKLSDVYAHLFGQEHETQHSAGGDAQACLEIFQELLKRGLAAEPQVHYAKNPPERPAA